MILKVKTEGLEGDALKFAESLNDTLKDIPQGITKAELDAAIEKFKTDNPAPTPEISKAMFNELQETVNQLKEMNAGGAEKEAKISEAIKSNKPALVKMIKGEAGEVTIKADTTRASIATNPNQMVIPGIGQLIRVARSLYDIFRKVNLPVGSHNGTIKYLDWDEDTTAKAAAFVAENGTFPESTAAFKGYTVSLKKVGDSLPVTEEFFEDEANAAAELEMFLENNVNSKIDNDLVNGNDSGDNLKGLLASIPAYTLPTTGTVVKANIYDLFVSVKGAITSAAGNKYNPDFMAMNNASVNRLLLQKDANENYQFPPNHPIFNVIVEDNSIADNVLVVGDRRFGSIYEMGGITLSRGVINTQFVKDVITLKARKRLLFLIKNSDRSGFRKVTDIDAALTALTITAP